MLSLSNFLLHFHFLQYSPVDEKKQQQRVVFPLIRDDTVEDFVLGVFSNEAELSPVPAAPSSSGLSWRAAAKRVPASPATVS